MEKFKQKIYGTYDIDFGIREVFLAPSNADAIRGFATMCKNEKSQAHNWPEKFQLWYLGTINEIGKIEPEQTVLENAETFAPEKTK